MDQLADMMPTRCPKCGQTGARTVGEQVSGWHGPKYIEEYEHHREFPPIVTCRMRYNCAVCGWWFYTLPLDERDQAEGREHA